MTVSAQSSPRQMPQLVLYDLHQVARFLHAVAYASVTANNIKVVHHSLLDGGDQIEYACDQRTIRAQADSLASSMMNCFSALCKTGSKQAVEGFLKQQRLRYIMSRRAMNSVFAQFRSSNDALQKNLGIAADVAHIVHGTANATFGVLSFFVTGGSGLAAARALNFVDNLISGPSVIGVVKDEALSRSIDKIGDQYSKRATESLSNVLTRDWKYQGALRNAETRFATQAGVTAGARTLSLFLAVETIKGNLEEIRDASDRLAHGQLPAGPQQVESVPNLAVPLPQ